ncbi:MAG: hypothetical protein JST26_05765 [Bacteroidetes bacterium]|nr:hypothetical protein [Bacteroidota bacterium]
MKHHQNRSQLWFKVLSPEGRDLDNEMKKWPLPDGEKKGEWFISGSRIGTWLVLDPKEHMQKTNRVFIAELEKSEPIIELPGIIWVRQVRLIREATNLDLKPFGIYRVFKQII